MHTWHRGTASLLSYILALAAAAPALAQGTTTRVSVSSAEAQGNGPSVAPTISGDGRFVAFTSVATNLVRGDTNGLNDTFVRDRQRGTTVRVSVGAGGRQQDGPSLGLNIARNGRYVAFASFATNLVRGDTNAQSDVFVRDLRAGVTRRASVGTGGAQANGGTGFPAISAGGRFVAFASSATNLVPGDTNGSEDVFVRDRRARTTTRVSLGAGGAQGNGDSPTVSFPAISADGRFVAFDSAATNLVRGDTNAFLDIFVRDRQRRETVRVSLGDDGAQANEGSAEPSISDNGRFVAFRSDASNLVPGDTNQATDVFVRDLRTGRTRRVSVGPDGQQANGSSRPGLAGNALSADGRFVIFISSASNLVPQDTNDVDDVFVRDLRLGRTSRVSLRADGGQGNDASGGLSPAISADGRFAAFISFANNLVPGDTNDTVDVFVRDRGKPARAR